MMTNERKFKQINSLIKKSKKPLFIIGAGFDRNEVSTLLSFGIPIFHTWGAKDYLDSSEFLNMGDFGVTSQRIGNFAIKHADLIIVLGSRLDTHQFLETKAKTVRVDIDPSELETSGDIKLKMDAVKFLNRLTSPGWRWPSWTGNLRELKLSEINKYQETRPYKLIKHLSKLAFSDSVIITDAGQTLTWTMQSWRIKEGQRLISAFNNSPMGYAIPAAIGAYFAGFEKILVTIGDGGFYMNLQDLSIIGELQIPIKIFVFDNGGYGMIEQTQSDWDELTMGVATQPEMASIEGLAKAHNIGFVQINENSDLRKLKSVLYSSKPIICRIKIPKGTKIQSKLKFGDSLTDLTPKLNKKEKKKINEILKKSK